MTFDKNKKLYELLGIPYCPRTYEDTIGRICSTEYHLQNSSSPNFLTDGGRIELLRIMEKREDYFSFRRFMIVRFFEDFYEPFSELQPGTKLADSVIEFMEARK